MSRWTRQRVLTVDPAPGTILPGVPLSNASAAAGVTAAPAPINDPRSGGLAELEELASRVSARPPVAIMAPAASAAPPPDSAATTPSAEAASAQATASVLTPAEAEHLWASGPWPDPDSAAWPNVRPSWGAPPAGFGLPGGRPRARLTFADGSMATVAGDEARDLVEAASTLAV